MKKLITIIILMAFWANSVIPGYAQVASRVSGMSAFTQPGTMVSVSAAFLPPVLKGVKIDVKNPFNFDFILSAGDATASAAASEAAKLVRYFMASLAVPENELWVNLSPYEKDRIVPDVFGVTEMGRDLLAQDYLLKQVTASLMYPEGNTGKAFWAEIYKKAQEQFGATDIPVDTFNKVWIVPAEAVVYEEGNKALVAKASLRVMLESDYTAMAHHVDGVSGQDSSPSQEMAKEVVRSVVIPVLEKEINSGKNFAQLRQVYYSLILAKWYKENLKQSVLTRAYADQNKVRGIEIGDKGAKDAIYAQYLEAFKKGAFNYIHEEYDPAVQEMLPRKYFSGGVGLQFETKITRDLAAVVDDKAQEFNVNVRLKSVPGVRSVDDVIAELDSSGKFLWNFIKDDPKVVEKVRSNLDVLLKDGIFIGEVRKYLEKITLKKEAILTAADIQSPAVYLLGSSLLYAAARDVDIVVVTGGHFLKQKKIYLKTAEGYRQVDIKVIGRDLILNKQDKLCDGSTFGKNTQYLIEKAGVLIHGQSPHLGLSEFSVKEKLQKARTLMEQGDRELRIFMMAKGLGSPYKGIYRFMEAYNVIHDLLESTGKQELVVSYRSGDEPFKDFYKRFLYWNNKEFLQDGEVDEPRMETYEGYRFQKAVQEKIDLLEEAIGSSEIDDSAQQTRVDAAQEEKPLDEPTLEWLGRSFQLYGEKLSFILDQIRYEVVEDEFDEKGRLDKRGLEPWQRMLSDALGTSPMGKVLARSRGFQGLRIYARDQELSSVSGVLAVKWWLKNVKKEEEDGSGDVLNIFLKVMDGPQGIKNKRIADKAQATGGIDFNANNMNVQTTGTGFHLDIPSGFEPVDPGGLGDLSPVLVSVTPLESSRVFLSTP